jgi:hypothetical protein
LRKVLILLFCQFRVSQIEKTFAFVLRDTPQVTRLSVASQFGDIRSPASFKRYSG